MWLTHVTLVQHTKGGSWARLQWSLHYSLKGSHQSNRFLRIIVCSFSNFKGHVRRRNQPLIPQIVKYQEPSGKAPPGENCKGSHVTYSCSRWRMARSPQSQRAEKRKLPKCTRRRRKSQELSILAEFLQAWPFLCSDGFCPNLARLIAYFSNLTVRMEQVTRSALCSCTCMLTVPSNLIAQGSSSSGSGPIWGSWCWYWGRREIAMFPTSEKKMERV